MGRVTEQLVSLPSYQHNFHSVSRWKGKGIRKEKKWIKLKKEGRQIGVGWVMGMFGVTCWVLLTDLLIWMCPFFLRGSLSYGGEWWLNRRIIRISAILFIVHKLAEEKLLVFWFMSALRPSQKTCYYGATLYACACTHVSVYAKPVIVRHNNGILLERN